MAHGPHLALRLKDAIVDRLRDLHGARPDVSRDDPDVRLYLHVETPARSRGGVPGVTVGLDVSGDSLHARGYRVAEGTAPLRESLAATIILLTEWTGERPFVDPMCGSGTLAIEAAMIAARLAPGRVGRQDRFGFLRWPRFEEGDAKRWRELCEQADARALPRAPRTMLAADRDGAMVEAARRNAAAASPAVAASLSFREADARELGPTDPPAVIVTNPPYGERIGGGGGLEPFWRAFGQRLRTLRGHTAFVLVPDGPAEHWLAMRPAWTWKLMNGPLPVTLCRYDLR
jgi:putative N6-adenine-specific DNA methylase